MHSYNLDFVPRDSVTTSCACDSTALVVVLVWLSAQCGRRKVLYPTFKRGLTDTLEMMMLFNDKEAKSEETVAAGADDTKDGKKEGQLSDW